MHVGTRALRTGSSVQDPTGAGSRGPGPQAHGYLKKGAVEPTAGD